MVEADDGCRLWTSASGAGAPLVCCHGGPGLWDMFGDFGRLLGEFATIHRWDQRGCGRSERRGPYSLATCVADLDAVRRGLGLERMALLGHSWGAQLALRYALDHPERVTRLVYLSGVGLGWAWRPDFERASRERLAPRRPRFEALRKPNAERLYTEAEEREAAVLQWSAEFVDPGRATELAARMATPWFAINQECNRTINDELKREWREPELEAACRELQVPTLILDGAEDIRPRWAVDSLERALPRVTRVRIEGAGHLPWMEAPDRFRAAIRRFLAPVA
jgi:proline iminopeptidase